MYYQQHRFDIRCEWGRFAIERLAPFSDVVVIVDALSFTTCVDIAVSRGAYVFPYKWNDRRAEEWALRIGAAVASGPRSDTRFSLSPASLTGIAPGTKLVLPSPNGSTLSLTTGDKPTLAGCFRNARAIAAAAQDLGNRILIVPAGEQWPDGSLRPAIEDLLAAGSIIRFLEGDKSPEAQVAQAAFLSLEANLEAAIFECSSGHELIELGFDQDVRLAAQLNVSDCAPVLSEGAYRRRTARA